MFNWKKDILEQPIETMLLFEEFQLQYMAESELREDMAVIFKAHPVIEWFVRHKAPSANAWVDELMNKYADVPVPTADGLREVEKSVIGSMEDWVIFATTSDDYHNQPFNRWDEMELTGLTDFADKTVIDICSGTGKQAFAIAPLCKTIFCVEPVYNSRKYLKEKVRTKNYTGKMYVVDGFLEDIPFPDGFVDVTICGDALWGMMDRQLAEMMRVTKSGGMVIVCPGSTDSESESHRFLVGNGFAWSRFLAPGDVIGSGWKRKYWKTKL